tara:strand:- start:281 stop:451 length:171 start_codon:yes stop_codon:yes gene_type:complete
MPTVKKVPPVRKVKVEEAEVEEDLSFKVKVVHKVTDQEFEVSKAYYLNNKGTLKLA